jgi:hypothetical protein
MNGEKRNSPAACGAQGQPMYHEKEKSDNFSDGPVDNHVALSMK